MKSHRKAEALVFAAPIAVVVFLHFSSQLGPRASIAQPRSFEPAATNQTAKPKQSDKLTQWIASLNITPDMPSPLDQSPPPQVVVVNPDPTPEPIIPKPEPIYINPLENATLTSVMGSGKTGLASINGRIYRINETPAPGCRVVSIDAKQQTVGITLETGELFYLHVKRP